MLSHGKWMLNAYNNSSAIDTPMLRMLHCVLINWVVAHFESVCRFSFSLSFRCFVTPHAAIQNWNWCVATLLFNQKAYNSATEFFEFFSRCLTSSGFGRENFLPANYFREYKNFFFGFIKCSVKKCVKKLFKVEKKIFSFFSSN